MSDRQSTAEGDVAEGGTTATEGGEATEGTAGEDRDDEDSCHELDLEAWVHAVGGPKKGRLIGFGPRVDARSILDSSGTAADAWELPYCGTSSQVDPRVEELVRQVEEEQRHRQEQERKLEEERRRTEEQLSAIREEQHRKEEEQRRKDEEQARLM